MTEPSLAARLKSGLRLPVMAGPMFIASTADLVIAQCNAGIIGAMPALNPRSTEALDKDLARIAAQAGGVAPLDLRALGRIEAQGLAVREGFAGRACAG